VSIALWVALLLAPLAPFLPVPYTAIELVSANIPTAGICFNVAYGLEQITGGDRPTFERTGILFQARAVCSAEDITPVEPWHSINEKVTLPDELTYLDFPEFLVVAWTDRRSGTRQVHWANVWKSGESYGIFRDIVSAAYPLSFAPTIWLSSSPNYPGPRLEMAISAVEAQRFRLITTADGPHWIEAYDPPPTYIYLPAVRFP
jgi:hypothetical protein